ncbi:COX15/CtaA family protein [Aestuariimicrobium ganziense]|uniref:COX15/CtaA family protein n=1 Tax=Aestuariimicrobium ganziense TaxID=2773677 RepID=UPI001F2746E6|nr:COX15/CtaA family protein [Aestuariimicrobium ganziense]
MDVMTPSPMTPRPTTGQRIGDALVGSPRSLPRWALASWVANIAIIVTGAVVRLTGSGLGCPTWPKCTDASYVPRGELGHHEFIEFGNRTITFLLIFLAVMVFWAAVRHGSRHARTLALVAALGVPFQGVIGGITVLTDLNPFVVALHLLLSLALVVILTKLVMMVWPARTEDVTGAPRHLATATFVAMVLVCWLGTVVTGSGPHSGDGGAARTGFDIEFVARVHAASVYVAVVFTVLTLALLVRRGHRVAARWPLVLLVISLVQGAIGYVQYFTGLPIVLVLIHLLGAALATAAAAAVLFGVRALPAGYASPVVDDPSGVQDSSGSIAMAQNSSAR